MTISCRKTVEHKAVQTQGWKPDPEGQVVKMANDLAKDGWQLISVVKTRFRDFGLMNDFGLLTAFFRREFEEEIQ